METNNVFKPMARIISQIGDQLISNEEVALLELIKNSYDARANYISIVIDQIKRVMVIEDNGKGMTMEQLKNNWFVLGTVNRYIEKQELKKTININSELNNNNEYVPLGEKGLGRFSAKKLGKFLKIETKSSKERVKNNLEVNWKDFDYDSEKFLDEIKIPTWQETSYNEESFTILTIRDLQKLHKWSLDELRKLIIGKVSKFINPFNEKLNRKLTIDFEIIIPIYDEHGTIISQKKEYINTSELSKDLLEQSHEKIFGEFDGEKIKYKYLIKQNSKILDYNDEYIPVHMDDIKQLLKTNDGSVGPFDFCIYRFNRSRLKEIKGFGNTKELREILDNYCGGVMIYRDEFRVLPYGNFDNDWLELNKTDWLQGKGTRFYTLQIVGYINISSITNPNLIDQTNRQGLQENDAYKNLIEIIKSVFKELRLRINAVYEIEDKKQRKNIVDNSNETIAQTISRAEKLERDIKLISENDGFFTNDTNMILIDIKKSIQEIKESVLDIQKDNKIVKEYAESLKNQEEILFYLSAVGLAAEMVSHELHHLLSDCIKLLNAINKVIVKKDIKEYVDSMNENVKSIRALVSRIDDHGVTRRRIRVSFDLVEEIKNIANNITYKLFVRTQKNEIKKIKINVFEVWEYINVKANKGMIIQVFMNLISNSIYWLDVFSKEKNDFDPIINVEYENGIVYFYDNGMGIQEIDKERIFESFFSRRKDGRGLGLYIIREICDFHKVTIQLTDDLNRYGRYYKFCIDISNILEG